MPEEDLTPGQALAALRQKTKHTCPVCGKQFVALARKKTCSDKCRVTAWRTEQREKKAQEGQEPTQQD